jgi:hypothetical protein
MYYSRLSSLATMKQKKLRKLIQKPLRFHHQDIHEELDTIRDLLARIVINIVDIKTSIQEIKNETTVPSRSETRGILREGGETSRSQEGS